VQFLLSGAAAVVNRDTKQENALTSTVPFCPPMYRDLPVCYKSLARAYQKLTESTGINCAYIATVLTLPQIVSCNVYRTVPNEAQRRCLRDSYHRTVPTLTESYLCTTATILKVVRSYFPRHPVCVSQWSLAIGSTAT
jgi:hypothetical protein